MMPNVMLMTFITILSGLEEIAGKEIGVACFNINQPDIIIIS